MIQRRQFIAGLGSAAAWPVGARAQQPAMPVIGLLNGSGAISSIPAFRQGLAETGFVEGRNLAVVYRSAEGDVARLPGMATELVSLQVKVIAAVGGDSSVLSAKAATTTIPIVFTTGGDPVVTGLVASLNRPGGNITGVSFLSGELEAKRLGLLHELVPNATTVAVLMNPNFLDAAKHLRDVQRAGDALGLQLLILDASSERDVDLAFATLAQKRAGALLVTADAFLFSQREKLVALAAHHAMPAIYSYREFITAGGLASYSASLADAYRQGGVYTGRILRGEKPSELPVQQSTKIELVLNLKTAKALGLDVPPSLLARAEEVIE